MILRRTILATACDEWAKFFRPFLPVAVYQQPSKNMPLVRRISKALVKAGRESFGVLYAANWVADALSVPGAQRSADAVTCPGAPRRWGRKWWYNQQAAAEVLAAVAKYAPRRR